MYILNVPSFQCDVFFLFCFFTTHRSKEGRGTEGGGANILQLFHFMNMDLDDRRTKSGALSHIYHLAGLLAEP